MSEIERLRAEIASLHDAAAETQRLMTRLDAENKELRLDLAHANEQCDIFVRTVNDQAATITMLLRDIEQLLARADTDKRQ